MNTLESIRPRHHVDATRSPSARLRTGCRRSLPLLAGLLFSACSGAGTSEGVSTSDVQALLSSNVRTSYDFFVSKGLTPVQSAGIVGNLMQEATASIDPTIHQSPSGPGRGIAQWSAGGRWDSDANDNVVAYARAHGQSEWSLQLQLEFVWYELSTFPHYGLAQLRSDTSVSSAVSSFEGLFEGCGTCDETTRVAYAKQVLAAYGTTPTPPPPSRLDVVARGAGGELDHKYFAGSWSSWEVLDGDLASAPAVASWGEGRLDVFAQGVDNALWHKFYASGWSAWENLGGVLGSAPAATTWGAGRLDVFSRGATGHLVHKFYANGWSVWEDLGGDIASAPAVVSWAAGRLDVFAQGTDDHLWHKFYDNGWSAWEDLGGNIASAPTAATWAEGRLDVVAKGTTGEVFHRYYANGWSGWENLGGQTVGAPAVGSWGSGRLDVFVQGTDDALWHKFFAGSWSSWENLGGSLTSAPAVTSWSHPG
jgi:Phage tail lysozyme/Repeat of unknown function (DUF346)